MDSKVIYENKGELTITESAISTIVSLTAQEIEGVSAVKHNISEQIAGFFRKNGFHKGIRVGNTEEGLVLDVNMQVRYGTKVSDVALKVQENIKSAIEAMLDIRVSEVHVHVVGIDFEN